MRWRDAHLARWFVAMAWKSAAAFVVLIVGGWAVGLWPVKFAIMPATLWAIAKAFVVIAFICALLDAGHYSTTGGRGNLIRQRPDSDRLRRELSERRPQDNR